MVVDFQRTISTTTNKTGFACLVGQLPPEYPTVVQAFGRAQRHIDANAFLFLNGACLYAPHRFQAPSMPIIPPPIEMFK